MTTITTDQPVAGGTSVNKSAMENVSSKSDNSTLQERQQQIITENAVGKRHSGDESSLINNNNNNNTEPSSSLAQQGPPLESSTSQPITKVPKFLPVPRTTAKELPSHGKTSHLPPTTLTQSSQQRLPSTTRQPPPPAQQQQQQSIVTINNKKRKLESAPSNSTTATSTAMATAATPAVAKAISTTAFANHGSNNISSSSSATPSNTARPGPATPPLVDYPIVAQTVNDIFALLQTYGPLTYAQLEYNLPPLTASSSSSGRLNHHSLADILEILVATGLVQKVKEETTNTRYCMLQGIPRADVVHPTTVLDQIEAAHEEIKRSNERAQRLETLLAGSPKTTSHKEILKTLATDYPEILLDPVYVAALRSLHVDVGGGERERKVKSPSTAVKSPTAATAQANETAAAQANETTATVEQRKPQASSLASNKTTTPTTTSTAVKMAASASQTTAPAAVVPRVKDTPSTKPSLAKEDKESAGSLGGNDKSTNATLTDTVQKKAVVAEEKEQQSHPPEVAPSQSAIASNAPAIPSKPLPTDAIKVEVAIAVGDSATNETEQPGSGIDKAAIS